MKAVTVNEAKVIPDDFMPLYFELTKYMPEDQIESVNKAYIFAKQAHTGQYRISGEPYITHPISAAITLAELRLDSQCIMAALLHDVIEDTLIDKSDLQTQFGMEVAGIVDGVSKLTQMEFGSRAEAEAENFCKMIMAMGRDIRVILVKLADRLHNMRTISALAPEKRRLKGRETLEIYAPIANRLGMHGIYTEFEDLGFAALYPMRYRVLKASVTEREKAFRQIEQKLTEIIIARLQKHRIQVHSFEWRKRHLYSIYKKMRDKRMSVNEILEKLPLRIIVADLESCYRVLGVMHNLFTPRLERFKDFIAVPKANGYRALHTTLLTRGVYRHAIPIDLQIRSVNMNKLAEFGISAHWQEKSETGKLDRAHVRAQAWLNGLLEMHKNTGTPQEFVDAVKNDLFPDEVYVFTPKGKILELPKGASAVDFAYTIHSDIGNTCVAAKLDRRLAPLSTPLSNGQTVEIITAEGAKPNPAWLNFVVSGKARANIRQYLKCQQRCDSIHLGQELLNKAMSSFSKNLDDLPNNRLQDIAQELAYESTDDLFEAIGLGNQMAFVVAKHLLGQLEQTNDANPNLEPGKLQPIHIKGSAGMVVTFGECCYPIPGDPILALMNSGRGIVVHTEQCPKLEQTPTYFQQSIPACWAEPNEGEFKVEILTEVSNQRGALAKLAAAIADAEANIEDINLTEKAEQCTRISVVLSVKDRKHLAHVLRRVRNVKNVLRVWRRR